MIEVVKTSVLVLIAPVIASTRTNTVGFPQLIRLEPPIIIPLRRDASTAANFIVPLLLRLDVKRFKISLIHLY